MMAVPAAVLPSGADWTYEVKWDGYRAQIVKNGAAVSLASRNLSCHSKDLWATSSRNAAASSQGHVQSLVRAQDFHRVEP